MEYTLFIAAKNKGDNLSQVATDVFNILRIQEQEERTSLNYPPDDHYYVGYAENVVIKIYDADDDVKNDYPFRISLGKPTFRKGINKMVDTDANSIGRSLAIQGIKVFFPEGEWWYMNWNGKGKEIKA